VEVLSFQGAKKALYGGIVQTIPFLDMLRNILFSTIMRR